VSLLPSCSWLHASLPINLPSWDTPRRTADDILSTSTHGSHLSKPIRNVSFMFFFNLSQMCLSTYFIRRKTIWTIHAEQIKSEWDRCQLAYLKAKQQQTEAPLWLGQGAVLSLQTLPSWPCNADACLFAWSPDCWSRPHIDESWMGNIYNFAKSANYTTGYPSSQCPIFILIRAQLYVSDSLLCTKCPFSRVCGVCDTKF